MRFILGLIACVTLGGFSAALADQPTSTNTTQPSAGSTPAASPTAPASKASPVAADLSTQEVAIVARRLRAGGYHEEMHNGEKQWCRDNVPTGSRFPVKTCATPKQLEEIARQTRDELEQQLNLQFNPSQPMRIGPK